MSAPMTPAADRPPIDRTSALAAIVIALAVGALYVRTAARDIVFGDSPELTGAATTLGVAHPPGYPIWTVLGHLFTLIPIGTIPFRVSLFSVAAAVACVVIVYFTAHRLTRSIGASATAALLLALVPTVWNWSVVPEVFALGDALAAGLVYLLLRWHLEEQPRYFIAAAFVGGIGMAHHQTIALLTPAVLFLMWHHRRLFQGAGLFVRGALASAAGLLPYVYLPIAAARHPAWNWSDISSLSDVIGHVLRIGYGTFTLVSVSRFQGGSIVERLLALARSFTVPEALLVAVGLVWLYRRDRAWFWSTALAAAVAGPLFIAYTNTNLSIGLAQAVLERFFLLSHVVLAPVAAVGVAAAARAIWPAAAAAARALLELGIASAALAAASLVAALQFGTIDQSDSHIARTFAEDMLSAVRPGVILLANGDGVVGPIAYLRTIEGARPDVTFIEMPFIPADWYVRQLRRDNPQLALRYDRYDGVQGTLRLLVEPIGVERFDIIGTLIDDSLASTYGLYRRGLAEELRPKQIAVDLDTIAAQNDAALRSYHIPSPESVATRPWDRLILGDYGYVAYDVGGIYARSKRNPEARQWYQRALAIDPDLAEARSALAALPP